MLVVLPILIPVATAAVSLLLWRSPRAQRVLGVIGAAGLLASSVALLICVSTKGIQTAQMGGWIAPYGITLVADLLGAIMVVLAGVTGLAVVVYSLVSIDPGREKFGYYPLTHVLLMGVCGAFLTGDLFNLYVWFEVMLMASFVLLALGGERPQLEGAIKYVTINLISSAVFLAGVGLTYGVTGTLNMADLALRLPHVRPDGLVTVLAMLFLVAFGVKAAIFPLFFWLPASYHTPPVAVSAIFAGLLTKVGVYALIRVFTLLFVADIAFTHRLILVLAAGTMLTGVLGAAAQNEFRRILSFHIVSQIGYMVLGLGLFTPFALAGSIFYIMHHIIVKTNLFLVSGVVQRLRGSLELKKLGGLADDAPLLGVLFAVPALSLAGVPPLSGFFAKLMLIIAGLEEGQYAVVAVALFVGLLTLFSMTKIWNEAFWKPRPTAAGEMPADSRPERGLIWMTAPIVVLAVMTLLIGLAGMPIFALAERAAGQLLDRNEYIQAVLPVEYIESLQGAAQ
ncbi:MAG: Na+/H+ antiporter subunit D [Planctomycetaceae bacterium]|nr:Na+/H+ antiporter subunit D [Planctomycetaceae bacterium]